MNTKYTKDGRKVAVLGKLNAEEYIVQEIFIREGQEVPGGENFTAKGLLDAPAESWKEKSLRDLEARYERDRKQWEDRIASTNRQLKLAQDKAAEKAKALLAFANNAAPEQMQNLIDFVAGRITHVFIMRYGAPVIASMEDELFQTDSCYGRISVEGMRLLTLCGSSNGNLSWHLNHYRDGSGSSSVVHLCRSYEHALSLAQIEFDAQAAKWMEDAKANSGSWLTAWMKIEGLRVPDEVLARKKSLDDAALRAQIQKLRDELVKLQSMATQEVDIGL